MTAQGVMFQGNPRILRIARRFHNGIVVRAAPRFTARAARRRFCTAGKMDPK
jgi:hypothetical protein